MPRSTEGTVTIYALVDPRDEQTYYIGSTAQPLAARLQHHVSTAVAWGHGAKGAWIKDLCTNRLEPEIVALEEVPAAQARLAERATVLQYLERGAPLLNEQWTDVKTRILMVRITTRLWNELGRAADRAGMGTLDYVRLVLEREGRAQQEIERQARAERQAEQEG